MQIDFGKFLSINNLRFCYVNPVASWVAKSINSKMKLFGQLTILSVLGLISATPQESATDEKPFIEEIRDIIKYEIKSYTSSIFGFLEKSLLGITEVSESAPFYNLKFDGLLSNDEGNHVKAKRQFYPIHVRNN